MDVQCIDPVTQPQLRAVWVCKEWRGLDGWHGMHVVPNGYVNDKHKYECVHIVTFCR